MRKLLSVALTASVLSASPQAFAAKQKYNRYYQKKDVVVQRKRPYFQERDLPVADAYLQVSRKQPVVNVKYDAGQTDFRIKEGKVLCNGLETLSCTAFSVAFSAETDCETSQIVLNVKETQKMTIVISSKYPKGTCQFDKIMKHELSHENIYRNSLKTFIEKTKLELMAAYEYGQKKSKGCEDVRKSVSDAALKASTAFAATAAGENARRDSENGEHPYDMNACKQEQNEITS